VQFVWNGKLPRKKNWALENIPWQDEWVLIIDADERSRRNWNVRFARRSAAPTSTDFISTAGLVFGRVDKSLRLFSKLEPAPVPASARPI
jgi:hypothetical protein